MSRSPLLAHRRPADVLAVRHGTELTVERFLLDAAALAARLPERAQVLNDCADRYLFLVGFAAAMLRRQVSLLPGNRAAHVWEQLKEDYPDVYCLTDQDDAPRVMELFRCVGADAPVGAGPAPEIPSFPDTQVAAIAFTSGSSGRPKPFRKFWGAVAREACAGGKALGLGPDGGGCIVATVPPQHMYGFVASVMLPLQHRYAFSAERPFFPEDIRLVLERCQRPAVLVTTPVQLRACVQERTRLPRLDFILSSAAPLPRAVADQAEALFHTRVLEYYGSTETGAIAARRQAEADVWRCFDGVRVRVAPSGFRVDADYFPEPVVLSDVVEIKSPTEFLLLGRDSDMIKIGGKRSSLVHLNQQLSEIEGVLDGAFFLAEAQEAREPRLAAFVVAPGRTRAEILDALRRRVDEVFLPRHLHLVAALPRSTTGKLPRENLLRLLRAETEKNGASAERQSNGETTDEHG